MRAPVQRAPADGLFRTIVGRFLDDLHVVDMGFADTGHRDFDKLGIAENTIVMFLSDNGGCTEEPGGRDDTQEPGTGSAGLSSKGRDIVYMCDPSRMCLEGSL